MASGRLRIRSASRAYPSATAGAISARTPDDAASSRQSWSCPMGCRPLLRARAPLVGCAQRRRRRDGGGLLAERRVACRAGFVAPAVRQRHVARHVAMATDDVWHVYESGKPIEIAQGPRPALDIACVDDCQMAGTFQGRAGPGRSSAEIAADRCSGRHQLTACLHRHNPRRCPDSGERSVVFLERGHSPSQRHRGPPHTDGDV